MQNGPTRIQLDWHTVSNSVRVSTRVLTRLATLLLVFAVACDDSSNSSTSSSGGSGTDTAGDSGGSGGSAGTEGDSEGTDDSGADTDDGSPDTTPPNAPPSLYLETEGETSLRARWPAVSDDRTALSDIVYQVFVSETEGGQDLTMAPQGVTEPGATDFQIRDLTPGREYFAVVRAVDEAGNVSDPSPEGSAATIDSSPPSFGGIEDLQPQPDGSLVASWSDATDTGTDAANMRYQVFVSDESGAHDFNSPRMTTGPGAVAATITGLDEYTEYFVTVRAMDESDNLDSNLAERSARTADVSAPTFGGVREMAAAGAAIQLQWDPATDNVDDPSQIRYGIYVATTPNGHDFSSMPYAYTLRGATNYTLTNLMLLTDYYVVVRAEDTAGNIDQNTNERSATTGSSADAGAPTFGGLVLIEARNATTLYVAWDPATDDATSEENLVYDIYVAQELGTQNFMVPTLSTEPGATNSLINGLVPETTYYVVVRARDLAGNQDENTIQGIATTLSDVTAPNFDGILTATPISATEILLDWSAATDDVDGENLIRYRIFYSEESGMQDFTEPNAFSGRGVTTHTVVGLEPETTLYFVVRAEDMVGNVETNTVEVSATTPADTTPPTFGGIVSLTAESESSMRATWAAASDDASLPENIFYRVYVATSSNGQDFGNPTIETDVGITEALIEGLDDGAEYFVVVRAIDEYLNEDTNTVELSEFTLSDMEPPTFGGALNVSDAGETNLTVNWNPATDNVTDHAQMRYEVCMTQSDGGCNGGGWAANQGTVTGGTSLVINGLTADQDYYFRVRARDERDNIESNTVQVSGVTTEDFTAPTFAGATSAVTQDATTIRLSWTAATDAVSAQNQIVYDIYRATSNGGQNYASATYVTSAGATQYDAGNLAPETQYWFVVRARDLANNRDSNTVQVTDTTDADNTPPVGGAVSSVSSTGCTSARVYYNSATDNAAGSITYYACVASTAGGCDGGSWHVDGSRTGGSYIDVSGLSPGYIEARVRAEDAAGNLNTNTGTASTTLSDNGAPYWSGSAGFNATTQHVDGQAGQVYLSWNAATDACTTDSTIQYEICRSGAGTNCASSWLSMFSSGTSESITVNSSSSGYPLSSNTSYTFYLRARDTSGNRSTRQLDSATTGYSYTDHIAIIFNGAGSGGGCIDCHGWNYAGTVDVSAGCAGGYWYIRGNNAGNSYLYQRMLGTNVGGTCGTSRMPGTGVYNGTYENNMLQWINDGAPNN